MTRAAIASALTLLALGSLHPRLAVAQLDLGGDDEQSVEKVEILGNQAYGDGTLKSKPPQAARFRAPRALFATDQETAQTHVVLVFPRKPATDADRAAGTMFSEYVDTLLYQEVREARGLAYTIHGGFSAGRRARDDASVSAYVGTQGDKAHDAIDAVFAALAMPLDSGRLEAAKESIAQSHRVDRIPPRAITSAVYAWQDQGEKSDPRPARVKHTLAVDLPTLDSWRKAALAQPRIVSIAGDRKKIDEARLAKLAPVTWVPIAKLFGY